MAASEGLDEIPVAGTNTESQVNPHLHLLDWRGTLSVSEKRADPDVARAVASAQRRSIASVNGLFVVHPLQRCRTCGQLSRRGVVRDVLPRVRAVGWRGGSVHGDARVWGWEEGLVATTHV